MPHADPARSFTVAVRHLFRHLDNAAALRRNPLARAIFGLGENGAPTTAAVTLASMRSKILDGARICYAEDAAAGLTAKAQRQFAILTALCWRQPAKSIASDLKVSLPQLYRDRRAICERVTRVLIARENMAKASALIYDPLRFGLWRVAALTEQGFAARAVTECERILSDASGSHAKALTLLKLGDAALRLGDAQRAEEAVRAARRFIAEMSGGDSRGLELRTRLIDFHIEMHVGKEQDARRIMEEVFRESGARLDERADQDDLRIEILLNRCRFLAYKGEFAEAGSAIARASQIANRNPNVPLGQRVEIAVLSASFTQDGIVDPACRLLRLNEALTLAFSVGSAMGVLFASIGLAHQCMGLRDVQEAKFYADQALQIARSMEGRQGQLFAIASLAPVFVQLKRWSDLDPLIFDIESSAVPMTDLWTNLKLSQGAMLARSGRNLEALAPLASALAGARKLEKPRCEAMALREFALSLFATGRTDDARDCIHSALRLTETSNDALELQLTKRAASKILRDARTSQFAEH